MGMRFQKRIQILPWVWLNISKSGFSFSFGPPGLSVNAGKKGVKITAGIPGTGLSVSKQIPAHHEINPTAEPHTLALLALLPPLSVASNQNYIEAVWLTIKENLISSQMLCDKFGIEPEESNRLLFQMWTDDIIAKTEVTGYFVLIWDASAPLETNTVQALLNECELANRIRCHLSPLSIETDPMYPMAVVIALSEGIWSTAELARRMNVGVDRAAGFIDAMAEDGICLGDGKGGHISAPFDIQAARKAFEESFDPWAE